MSTLDLFLNHPIETLEEALHIRKQIDQLNEVLKELFGPTPISLAGIQTAVPKRKGKRTMSAEARERIAAAQRARWAKSKPEKKVSATAKRVVSAKSRAKIAAAQAARWAKLKGPSAGPATAVALPPVASKAKKGTRVLSPEGRSRIVAALKARHAAAKKGKK